MGDLFVLVKASEDDYLAFIISKDEEIDSFLSTFNMSPTDTNTLIKTDRKINASVSMEQLFLKYISELETEFPSTYEIAKVSREIYIKIKQGKPLNSADKAIIKWLDVEYKLFKTIENDRYSERIVKPFATVEELIKFANTLLNRRKSRAGKSLEHHLEALFKHYHLRYSAQAKTEGNKKPDFIFPSEEDYLNMNFANERLTFLGAKTTCKDRWRQILNEAARIDNKHLFTLQQGISKNQLTEMYNHKVTLVVPKDYINTFPREFREKILSLDIFIKMVEEKSRM